MWSENGIHVHETGSITLDDSHSFRQVFHTNITKAVFRNKSDHSTTQESKEDTKTHKILLGGPPILVKNVTYQLVKMDKSNGKNIDLLVMKQVEKVEMKRTQKQVKEKVPESQRPNICVAYGLARNARKSRDKTVVVVKKENGKDEDSKDDSSSSTSEKSNSSPETSEKVVNEAEDDLNEKRDKSDDGSAQKDNDEDEDSTSDSDKSPPRIVYPVPKEEELDPERPFAKLKKWYVERKTKKSQTRKSLAKSRKKGAQLIKGRFKKVRWKLEPGALAEALNQGITLKSETPKRTSKSVDPSIFKYKFNPDGTSTSKAHKIVSTKKSRVKRAKSQIVSKPREIFPDVTKSEATNTRKQSKIKKNPIQTQTTKMRRQLSDSYFPLDPLPNCDYQRLQEGCD